jgi:Mn2+/Fe2+ NRAMP family transporter
MRIGEALTSLVIRSVIFCFVVAALAPARRDAADQLVSFSRACLGFAASVTVTVMLMLALGASIPHPAPDVAPLGLRGTI